MHFDTTINLGNLITIAVFLVGGFKIYNALTIDIALLKYKVNELWKWKNGFRSYPDSHQEDRKS